MLGDWESAELDAPVEVPLLVWVPVVVLPGWVVPCAARPVVVDVAPPPLVPPPPACAPPGDMPAPARADVSALMGLGAFVGYATITLLPIGGFSCGVMDGTVEAGVVA